MNGLLAGVSFFFGYMHGKQNAKKELDRKDV
jgi:hypothetical protein